MKKDLTFLKSWLITLIISTLLWAFVSGFVLTIGRMLFSNYTAQCVFVWLIGTILICFALAVTSYQVGINLNGKSIPVSLDGPVLNLIIGAVVYIVIFAISKCNYITGPLTHMLARALWNDGRDKTFVTESSTSNLIWLCVFQVLIFVASSLSAYILAKRKQDRHNETIRKLREEKQKAEK